MKLTRILAATAVFLAASVPAFAEELKLAVTTSFHNSGLSDILLPVIAEDTGIEVQLIVVGTEFSNGVLKTIRGNAACKLATNRSRNSTNLCLP